MGVPSPTLTPTPSPTPYPTPLPTPYPTPLPTPYPAPMLPPSDAPTPAPRTPVCTAVPGVGQHPTDEDCRIACMLLPEPMWPCDGTGPCLCSDEPSTLIQMGLKSRR